jgi:hypothetical protein
MENPERQGPPAEETTEEQPPPAEQEEQPPGPAPESAPGEEGVSSPKR